MKHDLSDEGVNIDGKGPGISFEDRMKVVRGTRPEASLGKGPIQTCFWLAFE